jgi:thiosulfate reductase cytochrome b subunit
MSTPTTKKSDRSPWFKLIWIVPIVLVAGVIIVLAANAFRGSAAGTSFLKTYPGHSELPSNAPVGFPAWLEWQHFLSAFFILLIIRTGLQIRTTRRPPAYWTRRNTGVLKTKGQPVRISLSVWFHLTLDILWILNGALFYVLIFVTGQWVRLIPVHWDVFPNAISAGIQYASLNWPTEDGWTNYNALQLVTYFITVFIAAPLAILTGVRMVPGLAIRFKKIDKIYPVTVARKIHFPVMIYFAAFTVVHVTLVLATGALRNLNHMYGGSDNVNWIGFGIFAGSVVLMAAAWIAVRPTILSSMASLTGNVRR